jgi:hypothetical protein
MKNDLSVVDFHKLMIENMDEVADKRLTALRDIEKDKL